jgi:hypothetical protein
METTFETRRDALCRLARIARESGVRLLRDDLGEYWATSVSEPGWLYPLEPDRCGCRGFAMSRRCRHVAALHAHLGWLDPEPAPAAALPDPGTCTECSGTGQTAGTISTGRGWTYASITCVACHGAGSVHIAA